MISSRLKEVREKLGYKNQSDFAKVLNISFRTLQTYEQGVVKNIPHTLIIKLYEDFNVSPIWLLFGDGDMILNKDTPVDYIINHIVNKTDINYNNSMELLKYFNLLSPKQQEYYACLIKLKALENELKEELKKEE